MAFTISLRNNQEELNKINKNPAPVMSLQGTLRDGTSIVDPSILVQYDGALTGVNYAYIETLHRYYFITNIESVGNKLWLIHMHCDVLKTYAQGILNCTGVIARQENDWNLFLNDSAFKVYSNPRIQVANFPNKFTGEDFVLVMKGAQYT